MPHSFASPVISNWHTLFEGFSTSTQDFYAAVEEAVRQRELPEMSISREIFSEGGIGTPEREYLRIRRNRIAFDICSAPYGGGHFFSWWLARVPPRFGAFTAVAICFVAIGLTLIFNLMISPMLPRESFVALAVRVVIPLFLFIVVLLLMGYMVQEGMLGDEEGVMMLPVVGRLYVVVFNPTTYYRQDTAMMFRDSVRAAVNEVINGVRSEKGLRLLGDEEFRPDAGEEAATA